MSWLLPNPEPGGGGLLKERSFFLPLGRKAGLGVLGWAGHCLQKGGSGVRRQTCVVKALQRADRDTQTSHGWTPPGRAQPEESR